MVAKKAIVPQVSLSVKVGIVVMRVWLMQAALKQEVDQSPYVVYALLKRRFRTASDRARGGNEIAHPVNIFLPRSDLDSACHIHAKRPGLVDRFSYIFRT
jgi:hypothetical protein